MIENGIFYDEQIPEQYRIVLHQISMQWFWYNIDTALMSDDEFPTPEAALENLLTHLHPPKKSVLSTKTWEQKQEEARKKREQYNKNVLRSYQIK